MKRYPAVEFASAHGRRIAAVVGLACAAGAVASFARTSSPATLALGLVAAGLAFLLLRVAAEVVELVADTLLPK